MKKLLFVSFLMFITIGFSQTESETIKNGKKVILKEDGTWEYADNSNGLVNSCVPKKGFEEPKWISTKIRARNKTTVTDLKKFVSKDTGVSIDKIILLSFTEALANGSYILCVDGREKEYLRSVHDFKRK